MISMKHCRGLFASLLLLFAVCQIAAYARQAAASPLNDGKSTPLREGWEIQTACKVTADGVQLSSIQYRTQGWIKATVPSTVFAAQVAAGIYPDPYYGMNLLKIPGMAYPVGEKFSNFPVSADSPYHCGWWYRKQFQVPVSSPGKTIWLHFGGDQLPGRSLGERPFDCRFQTYRRSLSSLQLRHHQGSNSGKSCCRCGRDICAGAARLGHQLGGLEPCSSGQRHGAVGRGRPSDNRTGQRSLSFHPTHFEEPA